MADTRFICSNAHRLCLVRDGLDTQAQQPKRMKMELKPINLKTRNITEFKLEITANQLKELVRAFMKLPSTTDMDVYVDGNQMSGSQVVADIEVEGEDITSFKTGEGKMLAP